MRRHLAVWVLVGAAAVLWSVVKATDMPGPVYAREWNTPALQSSPGSVLRSGPPSPATNPPTVSTQPANPVGDTSATLNGLITDDGGGPCQYRFAYKVSGGIYINLSWSGGGETRTTGQSFSGTLTHLAPGTTYYFRAEAMNSVGTGSGAELSFVAGAGTGGGGGTGTTVTPPVVATQPATNATRTSAALNGSITSDGGEACQFKFRYMKEGGPYIETAWTGSVTTGQSFSETVSGLDSGTIYSFNAKARNSAGESDWGNEQSLTTLAGIGLPDVATNGAGQITGTSAVLKAYLVDDGGEGCDCRFRYWTQGESPTVASWDSGFHSGDTLSNRVTGLRPGRQYSFQVQAMNSAGQSAWSGEQGFSTGPVVSQTLLISSSPGGSVVSPGEGTFVFSTGDSVGIEAVPQDSRHGFARWSGTAVDNGLVQDRNGAKTTLLVDGDCTLQAVFAELGRAAAGFSLGEIGMNDPEQFGSRIASNSRLGATFVERVAGQMPDPNGFMGMRVIAGDSAEAKGRFGRCTEDRVLIRFKYLFDSEDVQIIVYLSNTPQVGDRDPAHIREVAKIFPPPATRPGSVGSPYWAEYEGWVSTGGLDLSQGTWAELELASRAGGDVQASTMRGPSPGVSLIASAIAWSSADVDDWSVEVWCSGICMDLNRDTAVDEEDFLMIPAACGCAAAQLEGGRCFEGAFTQDGYIDHMDMVSSDWTFQSNSLNMCGGRGLPLWLGSGLSSDASSRTLARSTSRILEVKSASQGGLPPLVILGKRQMGDSMGNVLKDRLYGLGLDGTYLGILEGVGFADRCQVRMVRSATGQVYLVNSLQGIVDLDGHVLLGVRQLQVEREPRYGQPATVGIGIQGTGDQASGRPLLDAAITDAYLYVVPVVIIPQTADPYLAAARMSRADGSIDKIYDDSKVFNPLDADNPNLTGMREIEIDSRGDVYVLNVQQINRSTLLWKYDSDGTLARKIYLDDLEIADPVGLCPSRDGQSLYLGTGQYGTDTSKTWIYVLSAQDLSLSRKIEVKGLQRTLSLTEDGNGVLWAVGFNLDRIDLKLDPSDLPGYAPILARIEPGKTQADAIPIQGVAGDLALPMSVVWTGR